jgi:hypothetical protein
MLYFFKKSSSAQFSDINIGIDCIKRNLMYEKNTILSRIHIILY